MARISDLIEDFIKQMLEENDLESIEIQRNDLANHFKCVPSQINYVIDTRFSSDKGYFVESRRGGGGCIKICMIKYEQENDGYLNHILSSMSDRLSQHHAKILIKNFYDKKVINERELRIFEAIISDKVFCLLPQNDRDITRAAILKHVVASLMI